MSIRDNLTPRERQIRETLAGIRPGLDDDTPFDPHQAEYDQQLEATAARERQVHAASTQFAICAACRERYPGGSDECPHCGHVHAARQPWTP